MTLVCLHVAQNIAKNAIPIKVKTNIAIIDENNEIFSLFENLI